MPWYSYLPDLNATLNSIATVLIVCGLVAIKRGHVQGHKRFMLAAFGVSTVFLASYLTYHLSAPAVKFTREGWIRPVYFFILLTHIVLAAVQLPLILMTIRLGLRDERARHRRWAKVTAPIWLYVSVTGVVVYVLLYRLP